MSALFDTLLCLIIQISDMMNDSKILFCSFTEKVNIAEMLLGVIGIAIA